MITDVDAVRIFEELRAMPISYKGDRHQTVCEYRAEKISEILHSVYGIGDVRKAWVYSMAPEGELSFVKSPFRNRDLSSWGPKADDLVCFNHHVAPIIKTSSGRELIFDTKFYSEPPEIEQWTEDFSPEKQEDTQGLEITDCASLFFFRDVWQDSDSRSFIQKKIDSLSVSFELWTAPVSRAQSGSLCAHWLETSSDDFSFRQIAQVLFKAPVYKN